ncbi:Purine nucleoside phosphorylase OS=Streptomyces fumanus OX=67302 GN=GCM10018772_67850 PE=3 SV=1 [Streptomyces fumanus]
MVPAAVRAMTELGADPARVSPAPDPPCAGGATRYRSGCAPRWPPSSRGAYAETSWGTPAVDVAAGVHAQLDRLGVRDRERSPVCTREFREDHFSYRRDRTTGRLAG